MASAPPGPVEHASGAPAPEKASSPWTVRRVLLLALLAAGIVLALFNLDETNISFVFFDTKAPLFLVIVLALVIGFLMGFVARDLRARRTKKPKDAGSAG